MKKRGTLPEGAVHSSKKLSILAVIILACKEGIQLCYGGYFDTCYYDK